MSTSLSWYILEYPLVSHVPFQSRLRRTCINHCVSWASLYRCAHLDPSPLELWQSLRPLFRALVSLVCPYLADSRERVTVERCHRANGL
jgi:hypothetical protein